MKALTGRFPGFFSRGKQEGLRTANSLDPPSRSRRFDAPKRVFDQAIVSVGNFAVGLMLARFLGPTHFGLFAIVWTMVSFGLSLSWALVVAPMQATVNEFQGDARQSYFFALFGLACALSAAASLCAFGLIALVGGADASPTTLLAVPSAVFLLMVQDFTRRWLLVTEQPVAAIVSDFLRLGIVIAALIFLGTGALDIAMFAMAFASACGSLLLLSEFRNIQIEKKASATALARQLELGKWLVPSIVLQSVSAAAPIYALGAWVGVDVAGGYRAALTLVSPIISLTEALETFLPLRAGQAASCGGGPAVRLLLWRWWWPIQIACIIGVVLVALFAGEILGHVFGPSYTGFSPIILPMGLAFLLQFPNYFIHVSLRAMSLNRNIWTAELVAALALIAMLILLPLGSVGQYAALYVAAGQAIKTLMWGWAAGKHARATKP